MAELSCSGVAKSYGERDVLAGVSLEVPAGTLTTILGTSGSGKTTFLRLVMGLIPADAGTIRIGGRVVAEGGRVHVAANRRGIGYVAQEGALFPHLSVAENVVFGLRRSERRRDARLGEVLALVGLDQGFAGRRPHELSGGEQRRVALARALAPRPRLVLLDEPFSGLDAALRAETREAVLAALTEEGTTAVLVTHDQAEALSMGREVAVLRDGRLVQTATPVALYRTPADLELARFVGEATVLPGLSRLGHVECALGTLPIRGPALEGPVQVMLRPEQIRLLPSGSPLAREHEIVATVVGGRYYGADTIVRLQLNDGRQTPVTARSLDQEVPAAGEVVHLLVSGSVAVYPSSESLGDLLRNDQLVEARRANEAIRA